MAEMVYILCALTSLGCALLLLKSYSKSGAKLLLWSGICFLCFFLNNVLLFVDLVLVPVELDLSIYRNLTALGGLILLIGGLIWASV